MPAGMMIDSLSPVWYNLLINLGGGNRMREKIKSIVIFVLVLIIIVGGSICWDYQKAVNHALNYSISSSFKVTQQQLLNLREELKKYENTEMSLEEFQNILSEYDWDYFRFSDYTPEYKLVDKRFAYVDFSDLNRYISNLTYGELPVEEVEFHKNNLLRICMYWNTMTFKMHTDYFQPEPQIEKVLEETNKMINQGENRLEEFEIN